jgi:FtsP/CotA-like multicopper oxidase with cupredoxin domain
LTLEFRRPLSRRSFVLAAAGAALSATLLRPSSSRGATDQELRVIPAPARARLLGDEAPLTPVWSYDGLVPGPTLRLRQGEPARIVVDNRLDEDTTVHWHGIRLPNAMDGVPGLTQPPIRPGESFAYAFTPPDAGTFWYHPHANSIVQLARGLAGALIVEEAEPVAVDRDLVWLLSDWRLRPDGAIAGGFGNAMEAAMSGRVGNTVTLNGAVPGDQPVRAGERIRLRLVNASVARLMALRFAGHRPLVVATDGQPCDAHEPDGGRLLLGPAMRIDVVLDLGGEPGRRYPVVDDFYDGLAYTLTHLAYDAAPPLRTAFPEPPSLPANPLPEPDLAAAERHELVLQGGMMGAGAMDGVGGMMGMGHGAAWAINGTSMTGDGHAGMLPMLTLARDGSHILTLRNDTAWWHPMHLHGMSFRVLARNGSPAPRRTWADTVLVPPAESVDIAFVADNPGDWMLHCHVTDHQATGMMNVLRVA